MPAGNPVFNYNFARSAGTFLVYSLEYQVIVKTGGSKIQDDIFVNLRHPIKNMEKMGIIALFILLVGGLNLRESVEEDSSETENFHLDDFVSFGDSPDTSYDKFCNITIDQKSIAQFAKWVKEEKVRYISFNLSFTKYVPLADTGEDYRLFIPYEWVWTYKGMEDATFNVMQYPFDFDLLSCGLLGKNVKRFQPGGPTPDESVVVNITLQKNCSIKLGTNSTDILLRRKFQKLVAGTAYVNKSVFCYEVLYNVSKRMGETWYYLTHFFGVQRDYTGFRCCSEPRPDRGCTEEVRQTSELWIVQIYGVLIAIYSPILLKLLPSRNRNKSNNQPNLTVQQTGYSEIEPLYVASEVPEIRKEKWIYKGADMSLTNCLKRFWLFRSPSLVASRIRRILFVLLTLSIIAVRNILYYLFKYYNVRVRIESDVPIGHLCIPFGFKACLENSAYFAGGPIIYIPLYILLFSICICIPKDLPALFLNSKELTDCTPSPIYTFVYISEGTLAYHKLVRDSRKLSGFEKLSAQLSDRFFMLFTRRFWGLFFSVWKRRFSLFNFVRICVHATPPGICSKILVATACLPTAFFGTILAAVCLAEILLTIFYYGLIIVFFIKLSFSGYIAFILEKFSFVLQAGDRAVKYYLALLFIGLSSSFVFLVLFFVIFIGTFSFVTSFTFLIHIFSFTFVGMVVYPDTALAYMLAALAILYYVIKCLNNITDGYLLILDKIVKVSEKLQETVWRPNDFELADDEYRHCFIRKHKKTRMPGVPRECFDEIAEQIRPFRSQVVQALVKLFIVINIIYYSVSVIQSYHQGQGVSLPAKTIAVIFVGLVPEFFGVFKSQFQDKVADEILENDVTLRVKEFWHKRFRLTASEALA